MVITAGIPRKPGMSRDDLLNTNYEIMQDVVGKVVKYSPNCILIVVTNPLDAMAQTAFKLSGFSRTASSAWPACWIPRASAPSSRRN